MANRTGQGSPIPVLQGGSKKFSPLEQISYGTASPKSTSSPFQSIAQAIQGVSGHIEDRLDLQAKIEGAREGTIAGQNGVPNLQDEMTLRGQAFNMSARDAVETQFELKSMNSLNQFLKEHESDPIGFKQKADAWIKGTIPQLQSYDPALAQKISANYEMRSMSLLSQVEDRHRAIVRDKQLEDAINLQTSLQDDLQNNASRLFSPDTKPEEKVGILNQMVSSGTRMAKTAHQMGADGRFLFDATQRVKLQHAAESAVSSAVGTAWLGSQKDMVTAYDDWKNGKASIDIPDNNGGVQSVPLKTLLGASGYRLAENEFFDNLKSSLAMEAQVETSRDRNFKKSSDQVFTDLSTKAQDGQINLKTVEEAKAQLEPDKYLALREIAKSGGATVSEGSVLSDMIVRDSVGEDIRPLLRNAYRDGKLKTEDYIKYYNQNSSRLTQGTKAPIDAARDSLAQRLGVLSKELGIAQSSAIGQASIEFETQIQDFISKNNRQPDIRETAAISNEIYSRYSAMDVDSSVVSLPLPKSMTQAEKLSTKTSSALILDKINALTKSKLAEVGGDTNKLKNDPEYLQEIILLKKYHDLFVLKETGNARNSASSSAQ